MVIQDVLYGRQDATSQAEEANPGAPAPDQVPHQAHTLASLNTSVLDENFSVGGSLAKVKDKCYQSLWPQHYLQRPRLELDQSPVETSPALPTADAPPKGIRRRLSRKKVICRVKSQNFQGRLFCVTTDLLQERVIWAVSIPNPIQCDKFHMLSITQIWTLKP